MYRRSSSLSDSHETTPKLLELDAAAIAQTKLQIGTLVSEIAGLVKTCATPKTFYSAMLSRLVAAMAASGAGIWQQSENGTWRLVQSCTLPESLVLDQGELSSDPSSNIQPTEIERLETIIENELDSIRPLKKTRIDLGSNQLEHPLDDDGLQSRAPSAEHLVLLECIAREQQPVLVPPGDIALNHDRPTNPTQQCLIFSPIPIAPEQGRLWLQVVQPPSGGVATHRGYLRFVAQIADLTADFLKTFRLRQFEVQQRLFSASQQLLKAAAKPGATPTKLRVLVQQLREFTSADQVILLQRTTSDRSWNISLASGLQDIDLRSDGSKCLGDFCRWLTQHWPNNQPWIIHAPDQKSNAPLKSPEFEGDTLPLERFFSMFSAASVAWLPLFGGTSKNPRGVGCILYWSWPAKPPENASLAELTERAQTLARLGLEAIRPSRLQNAMDLAESRPKTLGFLGRYCLTSIWVRSAVATMVFLGIAIIPVPFRIAAPATLQPSAQHRHYAPLDARITKVHVDYGQSVTAGQILIELEDRQLSNLFDDAISQKLKSKERQRDIESRLLRSDHLSSEARNELEGELETLRALADHEAYRIEALRKQLEFLTIRAIEDGIVATWNARQILQERPVRAGQLLLMIQQPNGPWTVDARIEQKDVGKFLAITRNGFPSAKCVLTSHPNQSIPIVYQPDELYSMLSVRQDAPQSSSLCVQFAVPVSELPQRNAGSSAQVTIDIGRGPLVWSVFGDAIVSLWAKVRLWI